MNHPTDLFADYVGGALAERERADVQAHLRRCRRCADEVALATASRRALAAMPQEPSPAGLHDAAFEEARRIAAGAGPVTSIGGGRTGAGGSPSKATGAPGWTRWAAAAGIAATIAILALALPRASNPATQTTAAAAAQAETTGTPLRDLTPASGVEISDTNYDAASIGSLAAEYAPAGTTKAATGSQSAVDGAAAPQGSTAYGVADGTITFAPAFLSTATRCLTTAFGESIVGRPIRVIQARYEGTPAVIGVYVSGPAASRPPDRVNVYVAARAGCTIVTSTQFHS